MIQKQPQRWCIVLMTAWVMATGCASTGPATSSAKSASPSQSQSPSQAAFAAGMAAVSAATFEVAARHFARAAQLDPAWRQAHLNHGLALERQGRFDAAAEAYAAAPQDEVVAERLARVFILKGDVHKAKQSLVVGLEQNPDDAALLLSLAAVERRLRNFDAAAAAARRVLLRDQKNVEAIKSLALIHADMGKVELAKTFFHNALRLAPHDASIMLDLGLLAHRENNHQVASVMFEQALQSDPGLAAAHANLGAIALRFRDYARARTHYERAIAAGMATCQTQQGLGHALEGLQEAQEANAQLARALEACPQDVSLLYTMATICMGQLRDHDCALKYFEQYAQSAEGGRNPRDVRQHIEALRAIKSMNADPAPSPGPGAKATEPAQGDAPSGETSWLLTRCRKARFS